MNIQYNVGIDKSENPIKGFTNTWYHSSEKVHRLAIIAGLSGVRTNETFFSDAMKGLEELSDKIGFISSDTRLNILDQIYEFPPEPKSFHDLDNPEELYVWRWITVDPPDLIIELTETNKDRAYIESMGPSETIKYNFVDSISHETNSLLGALASGLGPTPGAIPGIRITAPNDNINQILFDVIKEIIESDPDISKASKEQQRLVERSALEVSNYLGKIYGYKLDQPINYVQGVSISGRLRLKKIDQNYPDPVEDISNLVNFLNKDSDFQNNNSSGPNIAAMCWAEDLYEASKNTTWKDLLLKAANTYENVSKGISPTPCHSEFGCEDMFFIAAMMGRAFKVTKDSSYVDRYVDFLLETGTQQTNGLFWHNRTTPYFWGRGNGFAALAFSEALTYMPIEYPLRNQVLDIHINHLDGMINHQLPNGTWPQLIDLPGTYQELSVTCMIGYAIARGIRKGWLSESYLPTLEKVWSASKKRIKDNGDLIDVCSGTGFQQKRSDYIYRKAEYGYDDRGGSMAIWFSTEMALMEKNELIPN